MKNHPFQLTLARSGKVFEIPADTSILDVLEFEGVAVPSSCQQGVCGTCETKVLAGEIMHNDMVLTEEEKAAGDRMMICCSRANGDRLTLDL